MSRKKILESFKVVSITIFSFFLFLDVTFAQKTDTPNFSEVGGMLKNFNENILQNTILLLSGAALVVFLAGLVKFIFNRAKGNQDSLAKDKKGMLWGLVALFVLVTLWGIIRMFQGFLGVPTNNNINLPRICVDGNCQAQSSAPTGTGVAPSGGFNDPTKKLGGDTPIDGTYTENSVKAWPKQFGSGSGTYKYVAELQAFLNKETGTNITVDGKYGSNTVEAVKAFQTRNKLVADGIVGPSTKAVILYGYMKHLTGITNTFVYAWNDLSFGSRGIEVEQLQALLKANGCYKPGTNDNEDGIFGTATRQAVINFQNINALKEDAIVGPSTRAVIISPETYGC